MSMSAATEQIMFDEMMRARKHGKYSPNESNYERLFGTPERAALTLHHNGSLICSECLIRDECVKTPEDSKCMILYYDAILEWLRCDAE